MKIKKNIIPVKRRKINVSNPPNRARIKSKRLEPIYEYIILLHKICITGMSRNDAKDRLNAYQENIINDFESFGNIRIKNLVVPTENFNDTRNVDITVVFPSVESIMEKLKGVLSIHQERKLKIFKLLEEL
mgnify:CR=1 FL=1